MKYLLSILLIALALPILAQDAEAGDVISETKTLTSYGDSLYGWNIVTIRESGYAIKDTTRSSKIIGDSAMTVQTLYLDQLQNSEDGRLGVRAMSFILSRAQQWRFLQADWYQNYTAALAVVDSNLVGSDPTVARFPGTYREGGTWAFFDATGARTDRELWKAPANGLYFLRNIENPSDRIRVELMDQGIFQLVGYPSAGLRTTMTAKESDPDLFTPTDLIYVATPMRIRKID